MSKRFLLIAATAALAVAQQVAPLRPPAVPLVAHDPYFSVWSMADRLTDEPTKHWTGAEQPMSGIAKIDGQRYRFMGGQIRWTEPIEAMQQTGREITPTRTFYSFDAGGVRLDLTFLTPLLPESLDLVARPVTYLTWSARSLDERSHDVQLYFDFASHLVVNQPDQKTMWSRHQLGDMQVIRLGALDQKMLSRSGDNLRIDWGYMYVAVPPGSGSARTLGYTARRRAMALNAWMFPESDDLDIPVQTDRDMSTAAVLFAPVAVATAPSSGHLILAYDDLYSIEYFRRPLRPYWRRDGIGAQALLKAAAQDFEAMRDRSNTFDEELTRDLVAAGGPKYAALAILAYRQTLAAHKLVADIDRTPLYFSKENFSNGCIGTVDVTYPSAPFFLLFNPQLLKAQLRPILDYARSGRWRWPYAPHDLGQYPLANGQVYGGGEESEDRQMPVEESGNMLILLAGLSRSEGNAEFSRPYLPLLKRWAEYLRDKGLDPENQLSTDDFAGHLAHNTNLSLKAILALRSFADLAEQLGDKSTAGDYTRLATTMAAKWPAMANDGDHYRLAFDQPGTWSQKYNLVWDKLLGHKLFPPEIARKEIALYKRKQNSFGLPLDNRESYTKLDWIIWTATLADNHDDFAAIADPAYRFANESPTRVPLSDWYWTKDGKQRGFQARSVVGGVYIKMLEDPERWRRWASRARVQVGAATKGSEHKTSE